MSNPMRSRNHERGQAAVEFALVLPFLLVMLIGIVEFGQAWNQHQVITDAAREAARKAAISDEDVTLAMVEKAANDAMAAGAIPPARATIVANNWDGPTNTDVIVTIDLPYRFTFFGPLVKWSTGNSMIVLKTRFTMRNE